MKKYFFALCLLLGISHAAPPIQEDIVFLLKPRLNSDRIEYFFGSYGVEALCVQSQAFPTSRVAKNN